MFWRDEAPPLSPVPGPPGMPTRRVGGKVSQAAARWVGQFRTSQQRLRL